MCDARIMRSTSRTVSTTSTSGPPVSPTMVGSAASAFLATHGMMDTLKIFEGSTPSAWA